jgi:hypothetical protein
MTAPERLTVELLSDATFSRGQGAAGEVDVEIDHDAIGLPVLGGRALRGLLHDAWLAMAPAFPELGAAARRVIGPSADLEETGILAIADARVGPEVRSFVEAAVGRSRHPLTPRQILSALTAVRYQTALARASGVAETTSLRASRVAIRSLMLISPLRWLGEPNGDDLRCLALAALGCRHAGVGRTRGRGHVRILLNGDGPLTRRLAGVADGR